jgi:opacity protein-like surface antigen
MHYSPLVIQVLFSTLLAIASLANSSLAGADTKRAGNWEGTFQIIGNMSESTNGEQGSSLDVDSEIGFGFGIGYNINSRFALNFELSYIKPEYTAVFDTEDDGLQVIDHKMSVLTGQFNGVWNFRDGPFTPYLQAGIGWTNVDSKVADGPPTSGCWWDPWWGYVCRNFYSTYDDTSLSYGAGFGLRYEFGYGQRTFVKGSYNFQQIDFGGDGSEPQYEIWRIEIGRIF